MSVLLLMTNFRHPCLRATPVCTPLREYTADHRFLLEVIARQAGFVAPMAVQLDSFWPSLLSAARKGPILPLDGVLVRDWDPDRDRSDPGIHVGSRLYTIEGVRFAVVRAVYSDTLNCRALGFVALDRSDYRKLYRIAVRVRRDSEPPAAPPVLDPEQLDHLYKNTLGYLEPKNLSRIKAYGGRARRGVLLTGPPGNGKTMACRWVWEQCRQRGWDWTLVTPDTYRQARKEQSVEDLFSVGRRGIIFFDDMDIALRDRETVHETEDQAVFLSAMDGITVNEGVVFVFTTNCALELIDRAFKRPGRIDLVLQFNGPNASLRRQLVARWHQEIQASLDIQEVVDSTDGLSFAEIEELRNLLVMHFMESAEWDWDWALRQFEINRLELAAPTHRHVGFAAVNGNGS